MSNYTTEVRFICETAEGRTESGGYSSLDATIEAGRAYIFDFPYPIFDEAYKPVLESKILRHYYTREISEETVGLWKLRLYARMNEIMPFYNKLYQSELLEFNPLYDVDYTRTGSRDGTQEKAEYSDRTTTGADAMTGSVTDTRNGVESTQNAGSSVESGKAAGIERKVDSADEVKSNTGADTRQVSTSGSETLNGTKETEHSGIDEEENARDNTNDRWDYYSDTPQGTIGFIPGSSGEPQAQGQLANQTYLTNARHIHDDSTGSVETKTTTHGHKINETEDTTKTSQSTGSDTLTRNTQETTQSTAVGDTTRDETSEHTVSQNGTSERVSNDSNVRGYDTVNNRSENSSGTTSGNARNMEEYTERVAGKMGGMSFAKMLMEFRNTFINIDMMIIDNLNDLFFGLWE